MRWWDLPAASILVVAVYIAALRLTVTNWTEELSIIQSLVLFGVASGLALGQSAFHRRLVAVMASAYGLFFIFWHLDWVFGEGDIVHERLLSMTDRLYVSFENLVTQRAVTDPVLFVFLMALLFWIFSAYAGYTLTRHANAWRAMLPTGIAMFFIHINDPFWTSRSLFLAGYVFLALIFLSRLNFLHRQAGWRINRTHLPPYLGLDLLRTTMISGAVIIIMAWSVPALAASLPPIQDAWDQVTRPYYEARSRLSNAFASLQATVGDSVDDYYGNFLPLGRGNTLTESVVFTVEAPPREAAGVRYYWRARAYETWNGTGWESDPSDVVSLNPDEVQLDFTQERGRWETEFTFTAYVPFPTVHTAPQPVWVSRPTVADVRLYDDGTLDVMRLTANPSLKPGEIYQVRSSLTNATINELRASGSDYPQWVVDSYLQLPDSVTDRTIALAQEIAAPYDNPYDITQAITEWLRENITYNDFVPTAPQDRDIIDWLIFEHQEGFCNYYATAEIIMLRSLGIPARIAVGYAQGQRDPATNIYTVRQKDAHAWPEVYFPRIGWVEFEPTINQRPLRRPIGDPVDANDFAFPISPRSEQPIPDDEINPLLDENLDGRVNPDPEQLAPDFVPTPSPWIAVLIVGIAFTLFGVIAYLRSRPKDYTKVTTPLTVHVERQIRRAGIRPPRFLQRMAYRASLPLEAKAYEQINRSLRRLGARPDAWHTPSERGANLTEILPSAGDSIRLLVEDYHSYSYASPNGDRRLRNLEGTHNAAVEVRRQTWRLFFQRLFRISQPE